MSTGSTPRAGDRWRATAPVLRIAFALALAATPIARTPACAAAAAATARDTTHATREPVPAGRRAIFEIGLPAPVRSPLDSLPHPWPGVAAGLTATGIALPAWVIGRATGSEHDASLFAAGCALAALLPAAGHLYGRLPRVAWRGVIVRSAGAAAALGATGGLTTFGTNHSSEGRDAYVAVAMFAAGAAVVGFSALSDLAHVDQDVRAENQRRARASIETGWRPAGGGLPGMVTLTVRW
jgi:hypothetical protein